jgi:hypothetical protein
MEGENPREAGMDAVQFRSSERERKSCVCRVPAVVKMLVLSPSKHQYSNKPKFLPLKMFARIKAQDLLRL